MEVVYSISLHILVIWWAFCVLLAVILMFQVMSLLGRIKSVMDDIEEKYDIVMSVIFKPIELFIELLKLFNIWKDKKRKKK